MRYERTEKKKYSRAILRLLSLLLAAALLAGLIPVTAHAAEPSFTTVEVGDDANTLKAYLEMDRDLIINLVSDMDARIGENGDRNSPYVDYWCTLGSGTKVINLNGYDITLRNDRYEPEREMTMLCVPKESELVINDSTGGGEINYNGMLACGGDFGLYDAHMNDHNLIGISGGKLTVNGGKLTAGRSSKFWATQNAEYMYRQINGCAIVLTSGEAVINGGIIRGRGFSGYDSNKDTYMRTSAIRATGGKLSIYDGEFWGMGCADVLHIDPAVDLSIYSGSFDVHKQDYDIARASHDSGWGAFVYISDQITPSYGSAEIPGRIATDRNDLSYTGQFRSAEVSPKPQQTLKMQRYGSSGAEALSAGEVIEWDKTGSLSFIGSFDPYYDPEHLRSYDDITYYDRGWGLVSAELRLTPEGESLTKPLLSDGNGFVDLGGLSAEDKAKLTVGSTYYLRLSAKEIWNSTGENRVISYTDDKLVKIKIVEPAYSMPDLNIGISWTPSLRSDYSNLTELSPAGDGTMNKLYNLSASGRISRFVTTWTYSGGNGQPKTYTHSDNVTGDLSRSDFFRGISPVSYRVDLYKGSTLLGTKTAEANVLFFPDITVKQGSSALTPDASHRVEIPAGAAGTPLTLSCNANSYSGIFWVKDGSKIEGSSGKQTLSVDLSTSAGFGWYGLGYTMDGKDYISDQSYYLGVKDTGKRYANISSSAANCSV